MSGVFHKHGRLTENDADDRKTYSFKRAIHHILDIASPKIEFTVSEKIDMINSTKTQRGGMGT